MKGRWVPLKGFRGHLSVVDIAERPCWKTLSAFLTPGSLSSLSLPPPGALYVPAAGEWTWPSWLLTLAAGAPLCAGKAWCAETEEGPVAVEALATGCTVLLSHTLVHICKEKAGSGVSQACCHLPSHTHRSQGPTGTHSRSPSHVVPLAS